MKKMTNEEFIKKAKKVHGEKYDYSFESLPFDFYLPKLNMCIEFDGKQHFIQHRKCADLLEIKKRDEIKNIYCKENNIILHRINYKEIDIIEEKLNEIFI